MKGDDTNHIRRKFILQADGIAVYGPTKLGNGQLKESYDGSFEFQRLGGVKLGQPELFRVHHLKFITGTHLQMHQRQYI
jgi:hypothetical protein